MSCLFLIPYITLSGSATFAGQVEAPKHHSRPEYEFVGTLSTREEDVDLRFGSIVPTMKPIVIEHGRLKPLDPTSSAQQREATAGLRIAIDIAKSAPEELTLRLDTTHTYYVGENFQTAHRHSTMTIPAEGRALELFNCEHGHFRLLAKEYGPLRE